MMSTPFQRGASGAHRVKAEHVGEIVAGVVILQRVGSKTKMSEPSAKKNVGEMHDLREWNVYSQDTRRARKEWNFNGLNQSNGQRSDCRNAAL